MAVVEPDWANSMPLDILAKIAASSDPKAMKGMLGTCKSFTEAYGMPIKHLRLLGSKPPCDSFPDIFCNLESITLSQYSSEDDLDVTIKVLGQLQKLSSLVVSSNGEHFRNYNAMQLSGFHLLNLDLQGCHRLTAEGLKNLKGNPLITSLNLQDCKHKKMELGETLRGFSLLKALSLATGTSIRAEYEEKHLQGVQCQGTVRLMVRTSRAETVTIEENVGKDSPCSDLLFVLCLNYWFGGFVGVCNCL